MFFEEPEIDSIRRGIAHTLQLGRTSLDAAHHYRRTIPLRPMDSRIERIDRREVEDLINAQDDDYIQEEQDDDGHESDTSSRSDETVTPATFLGTRIPLN